MTDIRQAYGTKTNLTVTVASLTDTSMRQSTAVDAATSPRLDDLVAGYLVTGTGSGAGDYIALHVAGSIDGGTTYSGGCTGTDGAYTDSPAGSKQNLRYLGTVATEAGSGTYEFGPFSVAAAFGGSLPDHWVLVVENQSDSTLASSGHEIHYKPVYATSA